jgi:enediyne biosynthesis protein E4
VGDYANNGRLDLYTTTFSDDYKTLYRNDGDGNFVDITPQMGMAEPTYPFLSWGDAFFDYDNDGWKDLMFVSGHVYPQVDQHNWGTSWAERPLLFHNEEHGKKFVLIPPVEGTGLADVLPARGAAFGDLFNNGKIDVVINCIDHTPVLLKNVDPDHNHWVGLLMIGGPKSPRDAVGTKVFLTANGMRQRGDVMSGGSFESSNDMRLHFGLGNATKVDKVEVQWSDGQKETVELPGVDRYYAIEEGKGIIPSVYDKIAAEMAAHKTMASAAK